MRGGGQLQQDGSVYLSALVQVVEDDLVNGGDPDDLMSLAREHPNIKIYALS
jgi:hypothetical protein